MPEVHLEEVIYLLPLELIAAQRKGLELPGSIRGSYQIPADAPNKVSSEHYHGYRHGKVGACADIITWTLNAVGEPAVILTFRKEGVCFERQWWMQGGAIDAFAPITEFVERCAQNESGSRPSVEALIGFFRTTEFVAGNEKRQVSTVQPAYIGYVDPNMLKLQADKQHTNAVLMTEKEYAQLPEEEKHWYPSLLIKTLFATMPTP